MLKGTLFALAACLMWGLIFVVPQFLEGFTPIEIAMGRYFFYGVFSTIILFKNKLKLRINYPLNIWIKAMYFSLLCTFVYYTALIIALRYSSPALAALVIGISPITIAFYGNSIEKEFSYKKLFLPSTFIAIGLLIINLPRILENDLPAEYLFGIFCSLISLGTWTWYVVANTRFLKNTQNITPTEWSTLIGVTTLMWVAVFAAILAFFFEDQVNFSRYVQFDTFMINFIIGCVILGFVCSWFGNYLWNRASIYLPVSLAGQLTIFETIFGLLFVYSAARQLPELFEWLGIVVLLAAVFYGMKQASDRAAEPMI